MASVIHGILSISHQLSWNLKKTATGIALVSMTNTPVNVISESVTADLLTHAVAINGRRYHTAKTCNCHLGNGVIAGVVG